MTACNAEIHGVAHAMAKAALVQYLEELAALQGRALRNLSDPEVAKRVDQAEDDRADELRRAVEKRR